MNISIIGVGKLGLCFGLNLATAGYDIIGVDINEKYVEELNNKTYNSDEPQVNELLKNCNNIVFTTDLGKALENNVLFVIVNTPSTAEWKYDHKIIDGIVEKIIAFGPAKTRKDLIISSTTFPGYCAELQAKLENFNYQVSYNPEFIAQGTIIHDQLYADTVLIGEADKLAGDTIEAIYKKLCFSNPVLNRMSPLEAELAKISVNCFLTTKISFANMVGDIAVRMGANPDVILSAIGSDGRIGGKYLRYGFGFGGPCFPRDNRALAKCAEDIGVEAVISKATDEMNAKHLDYQIQEFVKNNPDRNKIVELEHITYKKESVLTEESQQLKFALALKKLGYNIKILDSRQSINEQYNF